MTTYNICDESCDLPNDGQPNIDINAKRQTLAGWTPKKAKAAFQWNTASLLLPRLVDELLPCVARPVVHCKDRQPEAGQTRIQCRFAGKLCIHQVGRAALEVVS